MTSDKRQRSRRIDLDVEQDIVLWADTHSPSQIFNELGRKYGFAESGGRAPSLQTVQRIVRDVRSKSPAVWSLATAARPDDAALVLPALGAEIEHSEGAVRSITSGHAEWVCQLGRADPTMPPLTRFRLARLYAAQVDRGFPTAAYDWVLALAPWSNPERFRLAYQRNWIPLFGPTFWAEIGLQSVWEDMLSG